MNFFNIIQSTPFRLMYLVNCCHFNAGTSSQIPKCDFYVIGMIRLCSIETDFSTWYLQQNDHQPKTVQHAPHSKIDRLTVTSHYVLKYNF